MQLRLMGRESIGSWRRRGEERKGERRRCWGDLRGTGGVPAVREVMVLTWLKAGERLSPSCQLWVSPSARNTEEQPEGTNPRDW